MRNRPSTYGSEATNNQKLNSLNFHNYSPVELKAKGNLLEILAAEGHKSLFSYIELLGLASDPNIIILSSMHHYFYDSEEMRDVKTVVNLKELNKISDIKSFIRSVFNILPPKSYFIGCYIDNQKENVYTFNSNSTIDRSGHSSEDLENGIVSKLPFLNIIYSIIDSRTNNFMSRRNVNLLFEDRGFKVLDQTEINGFTYFCAQRLQPVRN
ncbi:MAG: hypothetical protein LLG13_16705 [Bacteroidales bacterium]|nr:hypothetical protein [Bacteroidales bacterium]